jgi:N-acetylglutamate synthase-like GNAT family acetyltransferase
LDEVTVRSYRPEDWRAVWHLYCQGLLVGHNDPQDPLTDLQDIDGTYFSQPQNHFWVADAGTQVIGMVGVIVRRNWLATIRRLRVERRWQQTRLPCRLVETALNHCCELGCLKVVLDTHGHPDRKMNLLTSLGFQHNRSHDVAGKRIMEFYVNLYQDPARLKPLVDKEIAR